MYKRLSIVSGETSQGNFASHYLANELLATVDHKQDLLHLIFLTETISTVENRLNSVFYLSVVAGNIFMLNVGLSMLLFIMQQIE